VATRVKRAAPGSRTSSEATAGSARPTLLARHARRQLSAPDGPRIMGGRYLGARRFRAWVAEGKAEGRRRPEKGEGRKRGQGWRGAARHLCITSYILAFVGLPGRVRALRAGQDGAAASASPTRCAARRNLYNGATRHAGGAARVDTRCAKPSSSRPPSEPRLRRPRKQSSTRSPSCWSEDASADRGRGGALIASGARGRRVPGHAVRLGI